MCEKVQRNNLESSNVFHAEEVENVVEIAKSFFQSRIRSYAPLADIEVLILDNWVDKNLPLRGVYSLGMVSDATYAALESGALEPDAFYELLRLFGWAKCTACDFDIRKEQKKESEAS